MCIASYLCTYACSCVCVKEFAKLQLAIILHAGVMLPNQCAFDSMWLFDFSIALSVLLTL